MFTYQIVSQFSFDFTINWLFTSAKFDLFSISFQSLHIHKCCMQLFLNFLNFTSSKCYWRLNVHITFRSFYRRDFYLNDPKTVLRMLLCFMRFWQICFLSSSSNLLRCTWQIVTRLSLMWVMDIFSQVCLNARQAMIEEQISVLRQTRTIYILTLPRLPVQVCTVLLLNLQ